jgi:hypothetical protein
MITEIKEILMKKYAHLGIDSTEEYTLIGKAPHIGTHAWLHEFPRALNETEIQIMEEDLGKKLPSTLRNFYLETNGLFFFTATLSISGYRKSYSRNVNSRLPFSILDSDLEERPENSKNNYLFFGGYSFDGSNVFIDTNTSEIFACNRYDASKTLKSWPNLNEFLFSEIDRLIKLYDNEGKFIGSSRKLTLP